MAERERPDYGNRKSMYEGETGICTPKELSNSSDREDQGWTGHKQDPANLIRAHEFYSERWVMVE